MKETKSKEWFADNVSENVDELIEIGDWSNKMLHDQLSIGLNDPQTTIAIYAKIFDAICDTVVEREKEYDNFCLNVANRIKIGFTTTDSEDDEKVGNFMPFIEHCNTTSADNSLDDEEDNTIVLCTQWNAANIKAQSEILKEAAARGKKLLSEMINIKLDSHEFIIPMFCIIHSQIIKYLKVKRIEKQVSEYELNIAGLYTIGVQETEDAEEEIYFDPSIALKLKFKNDSVASGTKMEE